MTGKRDSSPSFRCKTQTTISWPSGPILTISRPSRAERSRNSPLAGNAVFYARLPKWNEVAGGNALADTNPHEVKRLFFSGFATQNQSALAVQSLSMIPAYFCRCDSAEPAGRYGPVLSTHRGQ